MKAAALWLAIALALAASLSLPMALHAAPRERPAGPSLIAQSTNGHTLFRIWRDAKCSAEALAVTGAQDGEFYRRAEVVYPDKVVDACWLTLVRDGEVMVYAVNLNAYEIPLKFFRPERRA